MPPTTKTTPKNETPRDKFVRLANKRVQRAISDINLVGQLASPRYDYTSDDVEAINSALNEELGKAMDQLKEHRITVGETFSIQ